MASDRESQIAILANHHKGNAIRKPFHQAVHNMTIMTDSGLKTLFSTNFCLGRVSVQGGLCQGRSLSGWSVSGGLCSEEGVSVWGSLSREMSLSGGGGLCQGRSLSGGLCPGEGVSVQRGVCQGSFCQGDPLHPVDRQTPVKISPCPKLHLLAVINQALEIIEYFIKYLHCGYAF